MIKLNSLYVDGFKNLRKCRLNFPPEGNILITGRNESGKSSLFEAIFFSLTSKLLVQKNRGYIDAIAHNKNGAVIDLIFQKNNIPARIRKKIYKTSGGGTTVDIEFWKNYQGEREAPIEGKTTEVDPEIEDFLGFDEQILLNSAFVKQKGLEGFMGETRQQRIDILNKLLNLEKIPVIRENFKSELKDKEIIEEFIKNEYIIHKSNTQIKNIEKEVREFENLRNAYKKEEDRIKEINVRISEFDQLINESKQVKNDIKRLDEELKTTKKELEKINQHKKKIKKFEATQNSIKNLEKDKEKLTIELKNLKEKLDEEKNKLKDFEDKLTSREKINKALEELNKKLEKFQKWNKLLKNHQKIVNELKTKTVEIENYNKRIEEKNAECNKIKDEIRSMIRNTLKVYNDDLKLWRDCLKNKKDLEDEFEKISSLNSQFQKIKKLEETKKELRHKIELKNQDLKNLKEKVNKINTLKVNLENYKEDIEKYSKQKESIGKEIEIIEKKENKYQASEQLRNQIYEINRQIENLNERLEWINKEIEKTSEDFNSLEKKKIELREIEEKRKVFIDFKSPFFKILILYVIGLISTITLSVFMSLFFLIGTISIAVIILIHFLKEKGYFRSYNQENFPHEWYSGLKKKLRDYEIEKRNINEKISELIKQKEEINISLENLSFIQSIEDLNKK